MPILSQGDYQFFTNPHGTFLLTRALEGPCYLARAETSADGVMTLTPQGTYRCVELAEAAAETTDGSVPDGRVPDGRGPA